MTFESLWNIIVSKNVILQQSKTVSMTENNFKKALKLAYDQGYNEGVKGYELGYDEGVKDKPSTPSLFDQFFTH